MFSRTYAAALTLLLAGLALPGCATDSNPTAPSPSAAAANAAPQTVTYGLSGVVTDATGQPIANARIAVTDPAPSPNAGKSCTTDGEGKYSLAGLSPGSVSLTITAPGFRGAERALTVGSGGSSVQVEFVLATATSGYAVAGRVLTNGKPVAGATIAVTDTQAGANTGKSATSDDAGDYRLSGLTYAQSIALSATAPGYTRVTATAALTPDNDTASANFELTPTVAAYAISGTIRTQAGAPLAGATVLITDGSTGPNGGKTATSDPSGAYRISGLTFSAVNSLSITAPGYESQSRNVPLVFGTEVATADFSLAIAPLVPIVPTFAIEGLVSSSYGAISGAVVRAVEAGKSVTTDGGGRYTLSGITGTSATLTVTAANYLTLTQTVPMDTVRSPTYVDLRMTQAAPLGPGTTIAFSGVATGGASYGGHSEAGFTIAPSGASWFGSTYGTPGPAVHFTGTALSNITGQIVVTGDGRPFGFSKVDLYSSVTPIPWRFVGKRGGAVIFDVSGTQPNTFGAFATISSGQSSALIDRLEIYVTNPLGSITCCSNPIGVDSIVVSY